MRGRNDPARNCARQLGGFDRQLDLSELEMCSGNSDRTRGASGAKAVTAVVGSFPLLGAALRNVVVPGVRIRVRRVGGDGRGVMDGATM